MPFFEILHVKILPTTTLEMTSKLHECWVVVLINDWTFLEGTKYNSNLTSLKNISSIMEF